MTYRSLLKKIIPGTALILLLGIGLSIGLASHHSSTVSAIPPPNDPPSSSSPGIMATLLNDALGKCTSDLALLGDDQRPDCDFSPQDKNVKNDAICFVADNVHTIAIIKSCKDLGSTKAQYTLNGLNSTILKAQIKIKKLDTLPSNHCYLLDSAQSFKKSEVNCDQTKCDLGSTIVCAAEEVCLGTDELPALTSAYGQTFGGGNFMLAPYGQVQLCPAIQIGNDNIIWYDTDVPQDDGSGHLAIIPTIYRAAIDPTYYAVLHNQGKSSPHQDINPADYEEFYDGESDGNGKKQTCDNPAGSGNADSYSATTSSFLNVIEVRWNSSNSRTAQLRYSPSYYGYNNKPTNDKPSPVTCATAISSQGPQPLLFYAISPNSPLILASGATYQGKLPTPNNKHDGVVYDNIVGPDSETADGASDNVSRSTFKLVEGTTHNNQLYSSGKLPDNYDLFSPSGGTKACDATIALQLNSNMTTPPAGDTRGYNHNAYIFPMTTNSYAHKNYYYDEGTTSSTYADLVSIANNSSYSGNGSKSSVTSNCTFASIALFNTYHVAGVSTIGHVQFNDNNARDVWTDLGAACTASGQEGNPAKLNAYVTWHYSDLSGSPDTRQNWGQPTTPCAALVTIDVQGTCTAGEPGDDPNPLGNDYNTCNATHSHQAFGNGTQPKDGGSVSGQGTDGEVGAARIGGGYDPSTSKSNILNKDSPVSYDDPRSNPYFQYKVVSGPAYQIVDTSPNDGGAATFDQGPIPSWPVAPAGSNVTNAVSTSFGVQLNNSDNSSGNDTAPQIDCHVSFFNPLSWFLCPLASGLESIAIGLDDSINGALSYNADQLKDYQQPFNNVRDLSLGLIGLGALVAIVSQAAGMELFDAYTIRKVLPRLFICTIGISLSWPLMKFFINFIDDIGVGVQQIIYLGANHHSTASQGILSGGGESVAGLLSIGPITDLGFVGLLSFAGTAALAAAVAYLVLVIRQMVITVLVIFAPIAIAAYLLPNTGKGWKLWWESFSKALLMFPMISGLIAIGRVFASYQSDNLVAFVAFFAPYFLIPLTFRFAGGLLGTLGGFVNDRSKGVFDSLKQGRGERRKENKAERKAGTRFEGKTWIPGSIKAANAMNEVTKGLGTGVRGRFGLGKRGADARALVGQLAGLEAQKDPNNQAVAGYNDVNRLLAESMGDEVRGHAALVEHLMNGGDQGDTFLSREEAEAKANKALRTARASGGFTKARGVAAFYNMARDGTALRDTDDLARLAARVGEGDRNNTFKYAAEAASISRQVGRSGLAAASEPIGNLAFAHSDQMFRPGGGTAQGALYTDHNRGTDADADLAQLQYEAWQSGAGGEVAYTQFGTAKSRDIKGNFEGATKIVRDHMKNLQDIREGRLDSNGQPIRRLYSDDQAQNAAAMIVEGQQAIRQGYGKLNNRTVAQEIFDRQENSDALKAFLDMPVDLERSVEQVGSYSADGVPIYASSGAGTRIVKNSDVVGKIAGDRLAGLSEHQRQQIMQQQAGQQQNEQENT